MAFMPQIKPTSDYSGTFLKVVLHPTVTMAFTITGYDYTQS